MTSRRGFTLLEVIIAMAILGLSLAAIFDLNAGAIAMHRYTKKLTVASMLARSKMTDVEQELYDKGLPLDDDEDGGDFSAEGWPSYKWRARILAPRTSGVTPEQLISAIFGIPLGGDGESGGIGDMLSGFMGGGKKDKNGNSAPTPTGGALGGLGAMGGMASGLMQGQFTQMLDQITKAVREIHLTVTWKEGTQVESIDLVTHIVSLGQGSDRNGPSA
ncbi:MAG: type IV pilus modification PilV family protein, partial [Myxococcaceae bacterium]